MQSSSSEGKFTPRIMLIAVFISIGVGIGALATWFVVLLTAYSLDHSLDMVLRQAIWVIPTSIVFALPISLSLSAKTKSQSE